MNALQYESSPYLLQHEHNPVHWLPWGEAAFVKAQEQNKPVLISIGYSSCHWCHVMAHESFEDQETAALMNQLFVCVKIDREEYPDVDHLYMDAVQAMTGSGGWPLNVFTTPDKKPFYGGTYFPPQRTHGRASWKEVLINVSQYYSQNKADVEVQANKLIAHLSALNSNEQVKLNETDLLFENAIERCKKMAAKILANADTEEGGFGTAPKFPSTFSIKFLLDHYVLANNENALQHACLSLDKMMMGGIYDHLRGGFARYSTDKFWIAPHFEKMLYDNALLIEVYAVAFSITKNKNYKLIIDQIIGWLQSEMMSDEFGFYSAQDADSEGIEGKYYTWSYAELSEVLQEEMSWFAEYYNIKENGNWEHTNILFTTYNSTSVISSTQRERLAEIHEKLLIIRDKRIKPLTDDKILLAWNALMNKALVSAYLHTQEKEYLTLAERNMNFLLTKFKSESHLYFHTYKNGEAKIAAYIDDLAFLMDALIALSKATADMDYLNQAKTIANFIDLHFQHEGDILYQFTHKSFQQVATNKKEIYDGAIPSPNAILCKCFKYLSLVFQSSIFKNKHKQMLQTNIQKIEQYPASFAAWASCYQLQSPECKEVSIVGERAKEFYLRLCNNKYNPLVEYINTHKENSIAGLKGKYQGGETLIYICKNFNCLAPLKDINDAFVEI